MKMFWKKLVERKSEQPAGKRYFFVETKSYNDEVRRVSYNKYVVQTDSTVFPYAAFERVDSGAVMVCFEVNEWDYKESNRVRRLKL